MNLHCAREETEYVIPLVKFVDAKVKINSKSVSGLRSLFLGG
jgi:hypothetical protein